MASGASAGSDRIRALRAGRRLALAAIFEADFGQRPPDAILGGHPADTEGDPRAAELARGLVGNVLAHRDGIDATIVRTAPQYPAGRLPPRARPPRRCATG